MQAINKFSGALLKKSIFVMISCMFLANGPAFAQNSGDDPPPSPPSFQQQ